MDGETEDGPPTAGSSGAPGNRGLVSETIQHKQISELHGPVEKMLNVIDKLHLLHYQAEFLKITKLPRLHRLYFVFPTSPGEQYYNFVSLAAWLIQKCNRKIQIPKESDDPNEVIEGILVHVKDMGGVITFSPSKIKYGSGADVVSVLDFLTDKALDGYTFQKPNIPKEGVTIPERDDYEVDMAKIDQEMALLYSAEDHYINELQHSGLIGMVPPKSDEPKPEHIQKIVADVEPEEWRLEVERALPQLSVPVIDDNYDWSKRQIQLKQLSDQVASVIVQSRAPIKKLGADVTESLDKLSAREASLSKHSEVSLVELAAVQDKVSELRERQRTLNTEIADKNKELARLADDVETARKKLDNRGSVMADGAPVSQARKDLANLKKDISNMDVEIGVMEHYILKSLVQDQATYLERK